MRARVFIWVLCQSLPSAVAPRRSTYLHLHIKVVGAHLSSKMPSTGQEESNIDTTKRVVDRCHQESVSGKEETLCRDTKRNVCERCRECCQCLGLSSTSRTNASNQTYRCRQGRILRQGNLFGRTVQFKKGRSRNHPFRHGCPLVESETKTDRT